MRELAVNEVEMVSGSGFDSCDWAGGISGGLAGVVAVTAVTAFAGPGWGAVAGVFFGVTMGTAVQGACEDLRTGGKVPDKK